MTIINSIIEGFDVQRVYIRIVPSEDISKYFFTNGAPVDIIRIDGDLFCAAGNGFKDVKDELGNITQVPKKIIGYVHKDFLIET